MTIHDYPCDVCGAGDAAAIEVTRHYTKGEPIAVCRNCGFVYARWRPSPAEMIGSTVNTRPWVSGCESSGTK